MQPSPASFSGRAFVKRTRLRARHACGLLLSRILKAAGLAGLDRTLGGVFGLARGLLIMLAFALLAGLTSLPRQPVWTQAVSRNLLEHSALVLKPWLPPAFAERLRYH